MPDSLDIKGNKITSRFFLAPINTGLSKAGNPVNELINFHRLRSNKHTGINYVGNVSIDSESVTNPNTLFINSSMKSYFDLASEIEKNGSLPGIQIASFHSKFQSQRNWKNNHPNIYKEQIRNEIISLTHTQIKAIVKSFQKGIIKLVEAGFKIIQIHGAHGYFLNNFISKSYNNRKDEYGRDPTLIIKEILDGIATVTKHTIIDLRISLFEEKIGSFTSEYSDFLDIIHNIDGIDMISISNGIYNINKKLIYPDNKMGPAFMLDILQTYLQSHKGKIWNICGNIRNLTQLMNQDNHITYSIGRSLIADPLFIKKSFEEKQAEIVECEFKNKCHYFSRGKKFIECGVNKEVF